MMRALTFHSVVSSLLLLTACPGAGRPPGSNGPDGGSRVVRLWVANSSYASLVGLTDSQISTSGDPLAEVTILPDVSALFTNLYAQAVDGQGNLWVSNCYPGRLMKFAAADLFSGGAPTPQIRAEDSLGFLGCVVAMTFDNAGNLWMLNGRNSSLEMIASDHLNASVVVPDLVFTTQYIRNLQTFAGASDLQFDAVGNLWVTNASYGALERFPAGTLTVGNPTPTPDIVLRGGVLSSPQSLAIHGTFGWIADWSSHDLLGIDLGAVTDSGVPDASVTLLPGATGGFSSVRSVSVDPSGSLWAGQYGSLFRYDPSTLPATGQVDAGLVITERQGVDNKPAWSDAGLFLSQGTTIQFIAAAQLLDSGFPVPVVSTSGQPALRAPAGLALDSAGSLWVSSCYANNILKYSASQIGQTGAPTPAVVFAGDRGDGGTNFRCPRGIAFDHAGNLWVATGDQAVIQFSASQLGAGGSVSPAVSLTNDAGQYVFSYPAGLAFDSAGSLWVSDLSTQSIVELPSSALAASGSPVPRVSIGIDDAGSLGEPVAMTFDATGNLWVANDYPPQLVRLSAPQLAVSGAPHPAGTIANPWIRYPSGVAFDSSGNLWVTDQNDSAALMFPAASLGSASPAPGLVLGSASTNTFSNPAGLVFVPK